MASLSKLQIRAKVLSSISEIKSTKNYTEDLKNKIVNDLEIIIDRNFLFDVFIKEFIKMTENEYMFSSCVIRSLVSPEYIQDKVFDILKSSTYSDEAKYKLVQLLRIVGANSAYDTIPEYFDNPKEILDMETQRLLENAVFNPEAMLDFLDFIYAVPKDDKKLLLLSLKDDYSGDVLANIVYPILYADFDDEFKLLAVEILAETKSSLAIGAFNYLLKVTKNEELVNACNLGLKKLKLSGATEEKAQQYFKKIINPYKLASFYTTVPDGNGNQALLISRVNDDGQYVFQAVVINDLFGIVDCFGFFHISKVELDRIIQKFNNCDGKFKVSPEYVKYRLNKAVEQSIKTANPISYEFVCWSVLLSDIELNNDVIKNEVNSLDVYKNVKLDKILDLLTKDYTLRWFIKTEENAYLKEFVNILYKSNNINRENLRTDFDKYVELIFDNETTEFWLNKTLNLIYLLLVNKKEKEARLFYTMINHKDFFYNFKAVIVQRSVFNSFVILKENQKESLLTVNIFKKKNTSSLDYDIKKIDELLELFRKIWINE